MITNHRTPSSQGRKRTLDDDVGQHRLKSAPTFQALTRYTNGTGSALRVERFLADTKRGAVAPSDVQQLRYEDMRDSYLRDRPANPSQTSKLKKLDEFFGGMRVTAITSDVIRDFIEERREEDDLSDPSIRRLLVIPRAMFNQAKKENKLRLSDVPYFPMPADSEPAGRYIEPGQFMEILKHLPQNLHEFFTFMYGTGCRLGALQRIEWDMVKNDQCDVLMLPGKITKNRKALTVVLDHDLLTPIAKTLAKFKREYKKEHFREPEGVVFDSTNYRTAWSRAVAKAKLGTFEKDTRRRTGVRIHDCRCSAAINLLDAGVNEGLVLQIGGWKTRAMLDRYNRPDINRIRAAMQQGSAYVKEKLQAAAK